MSRIRMNPVVLGALAAALALAPAVTFAAGATPSSSVPAKSVAKSAAKSMSTTKTHRMHKSVAKVDLNSASKEELTKLAGIDDATADKIIAARPFTSRSELVSKAILTKAQYAKISSRVAAKSSTMAH